MLAKCTVETTGRSVWLSFDNTDIVVRLRCRTAAARRTTFRALHGRTIPFVEVLGMLPPLTSADFKPAGQSPPEVRADAGVWHVSAMSPALPFSSHGRSDALVQLEEWVREHWPAISGPAAAPPPD